MALLSTNLFRKLAAIRSRTGVSRTGDYTFGTAVNIKVRSERKAELVRNFSGEMQKASHIVYTTTPIASTDILFLDRADVLDLQKGLEILAIHQTDGLDAVETLYKVWMATR